MPWSTGAASASCVSSTTSAGSALRPLSTIRSPGNAWPENWMRSPNIVAPRPAGSAAPIPDVLRSRTHPGRRAEIAAGSRCRMALHRASKADANGFVESFNGRRRDECLNEHLFRSYRHARDIIEEWRIGYDLNKPHTSLDGLTPAEFAN